MRAHAEQGLTLYDSQQQRAHPFIYGINPGVNCLLYKAHSLGIPGYAGQAHQQYRTALTQAQDLAHTFTLVHALTLVTIGYQLRREGRATQEQSCSCHSGLPSWPNQRVPVGQYPGRLC